jgi:WD40 repeat protein
LNEGGTLVLATADKGNLYLFDVKAKKLLKKWEGHPEGWHVYGVLALPGRKAFVTSDAAGFIKFWNHQGEMLTQVRRHRTTITALAVSPDNAILATAGETQPIVLWDLDRILKKRR